MPGRSEVAPALSRLGLTEFTPVEPPAGAGTAGGTVDARGFGWLSDGAGAGFPVARGLRPYPPLADQKVDLRMSIAVRRHLAISGRFLNVEMIGLWPC